MKCSECGEIKMSHEMAYYQYGNGISGWQSIRYEDLVDGGSLFNRSNLIGYQLYGDSGSRDTDEGGSTP